jgi:hypothetical protein
MGHLTLSFQHWYVTHHGGGKGGSCFWFVLAPEGFRLSVWRQHAAPAASIELDIALILRYSLLLLLLLFACRSANALLGDHVGTP